MVMPQNSDANSTNLSYYPDFDLQYEVDHDSNPDQVEEVTIFPKEDRYTDDYDSATTWITADTDDAIPLDECR